VNSTGYRHGRYTQVHKDRTIRRHIACAVAAARHPPGQESASSLAHIRAAATTRPEAPPDGALNSRAQASQSGGNEFLCAVSVEQQAKDDE
jgi:hypothetical protein